jgi:hypothetical protein
LNLADGGALNRRVVMVTTNDRLQIPPIKHFWELVKENIPPKIDSVLLSAS